MQIWLKNVTRAWADVAEMLASPDEVNVWQVGAQRAWRGPALGDLVLFRREGCRRGIVGYGRFIATTFHSPEDAWNLFAFGNGAWSLESLLVQVEARRRPTDKNSPVLANALISQPVFFPPLNPFGLSDAFRSHKTSVPLCSAWSRAGRILIVSLRHHAGRSLVFGETPQARLLGYRTYRIPGTVVRVGRGTFRSFVSKLYENRCAISSQGPPIALAAAHAWPLEFGGPDDLGNLILLAVELHALWDKGLIAVDEQHRILVSEQVRLSGPDPIALQYAGRRLRPRCFGTPYPDEANLRWQRQRFIGPKVEPAF